jgi:uncharacterized protein
VILLDTSGLFAALARNQTQHAAARAALESSGSPRILSPFVLAELDYFVAREAGVDAELTLLGEVAGGAYELVPFLEDDVRTAVNVIEQYRDLGIGLADASLVVLAERFETERVLSLDERQFRAMRTLRGRPFVVLPADAV